LCVGRKRIVKEEFRDFVVDLCELLDELCALLGGQLECGSWDLIGFDDIDTM